MSTTIVLVYIFLGELTSAIYKKSLGLNVNLDWGAVLLAFGLTMLAFAIRARNRSDGSRRP